jgi:hypothetical protein
MQNQMQPAPDSSWKPAGVWPGIRPARGNDLADLEQRGQAGIRTGAHQTG